MVANGRRSGKKQSTCDDINLQHQATNIWLACEARTQRPKNTQIERINKAVSDKGKYLQFHFSTYLSSIKNGNINISFAAKQHAILRCISEAKNENGWVCENGVVAAIFTTSIIFFLSNSQFHLNQIRMNIRSIRWKIIVSKIVKSLFSEFCTRWKCDREHIEQKKRLQQQ